MTPAFRYSGDDGHVRFLLGDDSFTISLPSLEGQGPIWFADKGVFITEAGDATTSASYIAQCAHAEDDRGASQGAARAELRHGVHRPAAAPRRGLEPGVQELPAAVLAGSQRRHHARRARPSGSSPRPTPSVMPMATEARPVLLRPGRLDRAGAMHRPRPCPGLQPPGPQGRHRARADEPGCAAGRPDRGWADRRRSRPGLPRPVPAQECGSDEAARPAPSRVFGEQRSLAKPLRGPSRRRVAQRLAGSESRRARPCPSTVIGSSATGTAARSCAAASSRR